MPVLQSSAYFMHERRLRSAHDVLHVLAHAGLVKKLRRALNEASARTHMFVDKCVKFEKDSLDQVRARALQSRHVNSCRATAIQLMLIQCYSRLCYSAVLDDDYPVPLEACRSFLGQSCRPLMCTA